RSTAAQEQRCAGEPLDRLETPGHEMQPRCHRNADHLVGRRSEAQPTENGRRELSVLARSAGSAWDWAGAEGRLGRSALAWAGWQGRAFYGSSRGAVPDDRAEVSRLFNTAHQFGFMNETFKDTMQSEANLGNRFADVTKHFA